MGTVPLCGNCGNCDKSDFQKALKQNLNAHQHKPSKKKDSHKTDKTLSVESLSNRMSDASNNEHDDAVKDNQHNDQRNETKQDEQQYEYNLNALAMGEDSKQVLQGILDMVLQESATSAGTVICHSVVSEETRDDVKPSQRGAMIKSEHKTKALKVDVCTNETEEPTLEWTQHSTPVPQGVLSLEYATSAPTLDDIDTIPALDDIDICSQSLPSSPRDHKKKPPPIKVSRSTSNSLIGDTNKPFTFPTLALNTDNATKISAATPHQQKFKIVLIGESRVGKTAIIRRFVKDTFFSSYKMTLGAAQWHFECEVPIDLIEEIIPDQNLLYLHSMTDFLNQVQTGLVVARESVIDPFDIDDAIAEFTITPQHDYLSPDPDSYQLTNMDKTPDPDHISSNWRISNSSNNHTKSITSYGQFTIPLVDTTAKNTRKISVKLQIAMDIIDMGFHPTDEQLWDDINAIILVIDFSKKSSIDNAIDLYERFCKKCLFYNSKKSRRRPGRSRASYLNDETTQREYIPLMIAVNKCDKKREFEKNEIKKMILEQLQPIIDEYFPEQHDANEKKDDDNKRNDEEKKQTLNVRNSTLFKVPNLSFIIEGDEESDSECEAEHKHKDETKKESLGTERKRKQKKGRNDIRFIDIIQCSAKTGENIEKLFGTCIKKTIPSKLLKEVSHARNNTTAHITAPIWLRQVVTEFQKDSNNENHPFWDHT